jgi:hypothetical protein
VVGTLQAVSEKSAPVNGAEGTGDRPGPPQLEEPATFVNLSDSGIVVVVVAAAVVVVAAAVVVVAAAVVVVAAGVVVVASAVVVVASGVVVVGAAVVVVVGVTQVPPEHTSPDAQTCPQVPQLLTLVWRLTHDVPHRVKPVLQVKPHVPAVHVAVALAGVGQLMHVPPALPH